MSAIWCCSRFLSDVTSLLRQVYTVSSVADATLLPVGLIPRRDHIRNVRELMTGTDRKRFLFQGWDVCQTYLTAQLFLSLFSEAQWQPLFKTLLNQSQRQVQLCKVGKKDMDLKPCWLFSNLCVKILKKCHWNVIYICSTLYQEIVLIILISMKNFTANLTWSIFLLLTFHPHHPLLPGIW